MRVVVIGATGNVGTSLLQALGDEPAVTQVVGVARPGGGGPIQPGERARARPTRACRDPRRPPRAALLELLDGMRDGAGQRTPPLDPASSGPLRIRELRTGVGGRAF